MYAMYIRSCFNIQAIFHIMVYILIFFNLSDFREFCIRVRRGGGGPRAEKMPRAPRKVNPALPQNGRKSYSLYQI